MRDTKTTRRLRGQTTASMRRRLRAAEQANKDLACKALALEGTVGSLRASLRTQRLSVQLPVPNDFVTEVMQLFQDKLAHAMAIRLLEENPALGIAARETCQMVAQAIAQGMDFHRDRSTMVKWVMDEMFDSNTFRLSLFIRDLSLHHQFDQRDVQMRYGHVGGSAQDIWNAPKPVVILDKDIHF